MAECIVCMEGFPADAPGLRCPACGCFVCKRDVIQSLDGKTSGAPAQCMGTCKPRHDFSLEDLIDGLGKTFVQKQYAVAEGQHLVRKYQHVLPLVQRTIVFDEDIKKLDDELRVLNSGDVRRMMPVVDVLQTYCGMTKDKAEALLHQCSIKVVPRRKTGVVPPYAQAEHMVDVFHDAIKFRSKPQFLFIPQTARVDHEERLMTRIAEIQWQKNRLIDLIVQNRGADTPDISTTLEIPVPNVVCRCPTDECKGTVSKTTDELGVCTLCTKLLCLRCHEPYADAGHRCDPGAVASVRALQADTKLCPKCSVPIHRSWGCDQMCCTSCQAVFSWATGRLVSSNEPIHNPYALQFREAARRALDATCPMAWDDIEAIFWRRTFSVRGPSDPSHSFRDDAIIACHTLTSAMHRLDRWWRVNHKYGRVNVPLSLPETRNSFDIHVKYLRNKLTDAQYASALVKRQRHINKLQEFDAILGAYYDAARSAFHDVCVAIGQKLLVDLTDDEARKAMRGLVDQLTHMKRVLRDRMNEIARVYSCVVPVIDFNNRLPCHTGVCLGWNDGHVCTRDDTTWTTSNFQSVSDVAYIYLSEYAKSLATNEPPAPTGPKRPRTKE